MLLVYMRIFLFIILPFYLTACINTTESTDTTKPPIRPVKMFTIDEQSSHYFRTFPATVEAVNESELAFRVSGEIIERPVRAGLEVNKGDLIAKLDPKDFKTQVKDKQARYNLAVSQYQRAAKVVKEGHVSQAEFDARKAELLAAEAALKQAKDNLSYTEIYAPFSGEISKVFAEAHEFVETKQPIVMMQSVDNVYIVVQVPEQIIAMVEDPKAAEKVKIEVVFDSHPDQVLYASFYEIDTQADLATRTYRVRLLLALPEEIHILPGMSAKASVDLRKLSSKLKNALYIPASCVFQSETDSKQYVWLYDENKQGVKKQAVTVGEITDQGIEILEGLQVGDQVIVAGVHQIHENMKVRPLVQERGL